MELENLTLYPARIFRMYIGDERLAAAVVARVTYEIRHETLVPLPEQPWPVQPAPWQSPHGWMEGDACFYKGGADMFLFGHAVTPGERPLPEHDVRLRVGRSFDRIVRVFGARVWERGPRYLRPTRPIPFARMPLRETYMFGGSARLHDLDVAWPFNPAGVGLYATEEDALERPLPSIEDPEQMISRWDDRPPVAGLGFCPPTSPIHAVNSLVPDAQGRLKAIRPTLFNAAYPQMIAPGVEPGDHVRVDGASSGGPIQFRLPLPHMRIRLQFGDLRHESTPAIDQVGIEVDHRRVFVTYRYPFRYLLVPLQHRRCELLNLASARQEIVMEAGA